jgi:hypothetical protein
VSTQIAEQVLATYCKTRSDCITSYIKIIAEELSKINYIAHVSYSVIPDAQESMYRYSTGKLTGAKKGRDFGVNPDCRAGAY